MFGEEGLAGDGRDESACVEGGVGDLGVVAEGGEVGRGGSGFGWHGGCGGIKVRLGGSLLSGTGVAWRAVGLV